ncbi:hypothetical protein WN51_07519 [Melipona quadrifasciata]|uniref:Uncharacterized protein n=1 Tax=Melipona quadrifasciata TaxID=166423 RepID=A0A0N1IU00_9HYME|nr:hypothetical protein WN51_07519 [Melipona quadrifasciata]
MQRSSQSSTLDQPFDVEHFLVNDESVSEDLNYYEKCQCAVSNSNCLATRRGKLNTLNIEKQKKQFLEYNDIILLKGNDAMQNNGYFVLSISLLDKVCNNSYVL